MWYVSVTSIQLIDHHVQQKAQILLITIWKIKIVHTIKHAQLNRK